jgi:serine/threonine-protein kinase
MSTPTQATRTPLPPGTLLHQGMYRIERLLGEGGCALVYLARQGRWNLQVCIKEFFPIGCQRREDGLYPQTPDLERFVASGLKAFQDEAATLARFQHAGIVRVLGTFEEHRTAYLVQEYLEGMTFREGLSVAGCMPTSLVLQVALQIGHALMMVHAAGLVHSDLKPDNLFITKEGRYVILDFGLTRGFLSVDGSKTGGRGMTPGYCPPEQYMRGSILTPATDVYAFAATLYCLLTGTAPTDAPSRTRGQGIAAIEPVNPSITPQVETALLQAMICDATSRTPGVREFLFQLGLDATPKAVTYRPPPFLARSSVQAHPRGPVVLSLHAPTQRLYSGSHKGSLRVWNWPDMELLGEICAHERTITTLAVSNNGMFVVSGTEGGEVKLIPTDFSHPGLVLLEEQASVNSVHFHGDWVAVAFSHGKCALIGPGQPAVLWPAHTGPAHCVQFHPEGSGLASCGKDGLVRIWGVPEPKLLQEWKVSERSAACVRFSPEGTSLLSASSDLSVKFWDLLSLQPIRDLRGHHSMLLDARFTCLENTVVTLAGDHNLRAFSLHSARMTHVTEARQARQLVVDPNLPLLATSNEEGLVCLWEINE